MSVIKAAGSGLGGKGDPGGALGSFYSHTIDQSLRFEDGDSAHLYKTWGVAADSNKIYTFSCWFKRSALGNSGIVNFVSSINTGSGTEQGSNHYGFYNNDTLWYATENGGENAISKRLIRDSSAWYHITYQYDTTQSTATDRLKIYLNGVNIPQGTENWLTAGFGFPETPALNSVMTSMNQNGRLNAIGAGIAGSVNRYYFDGYLAEIIMLDGVTADCTAFGEFKDGVWIPKEYSGSFGTNGYHLDFADSSAIGNDVSGNNNDWSVYGLAATDVVLDSPTNNFATMNPLYNSSLQATLLEGNLKVDGAGFNNSAYNYGAVSTFAIPKDKKIYIEIECTDGTGDNWYAGFATQSGLESGTSSTNVGGASAVTLYNRAVFKNGTQFQYSSSDGLGGLGGGTSPLAAGDILGMAVDGSNGKVWLSKNGSYFKTIASNNGSVGNVGDPSAGSDPVATIDNVPAEDLFVVIGSGTAVSSIFINFGQDSVNVSSANADSNGIGTFEYAVPTDYLALCSSNLTAPAIGPSQGTQADDYFNTVLWTGNGSDGRSITGVGFDPDWVWIKSRNLETSHLLNDTVRGANKSLFSEGTTDETANNGGGYLSAFVTDGFSVTSGSSGDDAVNDGSDTYASWNWLAGTAFSNSASSNDATIASSGEVNTTAGFSIVSYTGNGTHGTVYHGLGSAPTWIIVKDRDTAENWCVWHTGIAITKHLRFNTNDDENTPTRKRWNDTNPTANVFSVGDASDQGDREVNQNGEKYIAYCFTDISGYSKFGTFVGNGDDDGPFVFTGFRPAWVMIKQATADGDWSIIDDKRQTFNDASGNPVLRANSNTDEKDTNTMQGQIDLLSNGFKVRSNNSSSNTNTKTVIYMAFANSPFKFSNAR